MVFYSVLYYQPSSCMILDVVLLFHNPVLCFLTPQNPKTIIYTFSWMFVLLITFIIACFYSYPGYISMESSIFWRSVFGHGPRFPNIGTFSVPLSVYIMMRNHMNGYHATSQINTMCEGWIIFKIHIFEYFLVPQNE